MENKELKRQYNYLLQRYYNGCNYLHNNPKEWYKYLPEVTKLLNILNKILEKVPATNEEVLNGFKIE